VLFDLLRRFARDRRGNVAMIFGLAGIPLIFAVGMGIDYGNASRKWSQMNAAADAAALAGVTPAMMSSSDAVAKTAAINMFTAQTNTISNLVPGTLVPTVTVTDSGLTRTVNVSYTAQVYNVFGGVLGQQTMPLSGHSQANGATPPNVDFYLVLDTSPSMAIPATQNGINLLVQHTQSQTDGNEKGCAFACHESNPSGSDNAGNPNGEDNYALAKSLTDPDTGGAGITLRIDEVGNAATAMVSSAINTMSQNQSNFGWTPTYRIAINTFDVSLHNLYSLTSNLSTMQSNLNATPSPIQLMEVYSNNNECTNWTTTTSHGVTTTTCTAYTSNNDADTNIDAMLTGMNSAMPTPGDGAVGDSPAEVLMIVTDGMEDECTSSITSGTTVSCPSGDRQEAPMAASAATNPGTNTTTVPSVATCTAIKNRGIKIAILYTTYYPLDPGGLGSWYDNHIYEFQPNGVDTVGPALQNNCASPGLFYQVQVGEDISAALVTLFQMALQSSHLTQ
jgi:Flp pilus assembly protein TadG